MWFDGGEKSHCVRVDALKLNVFVLRGGAVMQHGLHYKLLF